MWASVDQAVKQNKSRTESQITKDIPITHYLLSPLKYFRRG